MSIKDRIPKGEPNSDERRQQLKDLKAGIIGQPDEKDSLTSEQVDAITYAYIDVCATDKIINDDMWEPQHALAEIGEAVVQTKADLEKAFPFLMECVEDE